MTRMFARSISAKAALRQPTPCETAQTHPRSSMRSIEIHVDAVLDPRYVGVFREALQQRGLDTTVGVSTAPGSFGLRLRSAFARWLLSTECRILTWMGRGVPLRHRLPAAAKLVPACHEPVGKADLLVHVQPPGGMARPAVPPQQPFISVTFPLAPGSDLVGLAEVCSQAEVCQVVIEVWRAGEVVPLVCELKVKTMFTFAMMHDVVMRKSMHMVADCAARFEQKLPLPGCFIPSTEGAGSLKRHQGPLGLSGLLLLQYCGLMACRMAGKAMSRLTGVSAQWQLQLSRTGWRQHGPHDLKSLPNPVGHYRADPFVVSHDGRTMVFAEEFSNATQLGHIVALEVLPSGDTVDLGRCIQEPFHLSFPYVFKWEGQLYMCPEASESRQIRIYRCVEFPLRWTLDTVIKDGVAACDTVLFERDGLWWMMTNLDSSGTDTEFCSELHLFWADHPLSKDWHAHPLNPVVCDGRQARNGGLLYEGDRIFRVAQGHAYGVYGKSHAVYEITKINQTDYAETLSHRNLPPEGAIGSHHLSSNGEWAVSDSLRVIRAR